MHTPDRRDFIRTATATALTAGFSATTRGYFANETISVACIGTGGRCRWLMQRLNQIKGVQIVAVCDVWDDHLNLGKQLADPKAFVSKDFHAVLARKDVDAVVIGSPDHWHVPMTIAACEAGKDVYVEKPLTHDLSEGSKVIEAEKRTDRIVQVGTQQRSMPHLIEAREIIRKGTLGRIHKIHCTWNRNTPRWGKGKPDIAPTSVDWQRFLGNAPQQDFDPYRFRNWRWFWDFGGGIFTDLMVHWMDTAYWMLDMADPATAMSIGDHFRAKDLWETPDTVQTLLRYPKEQLQASFDGTFVNHHNRAMLTIMGENATLYMDRGRYELIPQAGKDLVARDRIEDKNAPRGADFYDAVDGELFHLANWIESVRNRKPANAPATAGVQSAACAHLANLSLRSGKVAHWPS